MLLSRIQNTENVVNFANLLKIQNQGAKPPDPLTRGSVFGPR